MEGIMLTILDYASYAVGAVAVIALLVIVIRKFTVVSTIDTENVPELKQEKVRSDLATKRLKRKIRVGQAKVSHWMSPITQFVATTSKKSYDSLKNTERRVSMMIARRNSKVRSKVEEQMPELQAEAQKATDAENYDDAERKLIEMISLNPKSIETYTQLADLYMEKKDFAQAKETFTFIIKLKKDALHAGSSNENAGRNLSDCYIDLATAAQELTKLDEALKALKEALLLEPNNPKYLDFAISVALELKDKESALEWFERLKQVNSENQKLVEFDEQIKSL